MPEGTKQSRNRALDAAIDSLRTIDTKGHSNTGKYRNLSIALNNLVECIEKYYPENVADAEALTEDQLKELDTAYSVAIRECRNYTSGKGDSRRSGYGQARLKTVKTIEQILCEDLYTI